MTRLRERPRLMVCAGEASGDRMAAEAIGALGERMPGLEVRGVTGPALRAAGVQTLLPAEAITAVGLVEAAGVALRAPRVLARLAAEMDAWRPHALLTVDSPGLLLRVARRARARGIPAVHLVSPQVWAWRPGRVRGVARSVDTLLCLLPFEPALYEGLPVRAEFVGHPAAAAEPVERPVGPPVFGLAPGSRPSEVQTLWPVFREVAARLRQRWPRCRFVVPVAPTIDRGDLEGLEATFVDGLGGAPLSACLCASGTMTLELAARGIPMVVAYRVHPLTWAVGRRLVCGVRHLALPNILAGGALVPEHHQHLDPDALAMDLGRVAQSGGADLRRVVATLEGPGAVRRIAAGIERELGRRREAP